MPQQNLSPDQQSWIFQQFNGTTYQPNAMDVQHEPLYDTLTVATNTSIPNLTQFFTNPAGKTLNQTNVTTAKKLDAPEAFAVMAIRLFVQSNVLLSDLVTFIQSFALEFWIGQKEYNRAPIWHYNTGGGIAGFSQVSNATVFTNGLPGRTHMHTLEINIVIDNQASFYGQLNGVAMTTSSSGTGMVVQMMLDGLHARGVQ